jgi:hypothetical protein
MPRFHMYPATPKPVKNIESDWVSGPVSSTGVSSPLEQSNYDSAVAKLLEADVTQKDVEVVRWPNWATGYQEEVFVRPNTECYKLLQTMIEDLKHFPCLDEQLYEEYRKAEEEEEEKQKAALEELKAQRRNHIANKSSKTSKQPTRVTAAEIAFYREHRTKARKGPTKWEKKRMAKKADNEYALWASENGFGELGGEDGES